MKSLSFKTDSRLGALSIDLHIEAETMGEMRAVEALVRAILVEQLAASTLQPGGEPAQIQPAGETE